jgi:hypothetical protein
MINYQRLVFNIRMLRYFINDSLGLDRQLHRITGFELSAPLLDAAAYNTYIETVSNKADTAYLRIKESSTVRVMHAYLDYMKRLSEKFDWKAKDFILAFDYTDEDFYGDAQGFDIHGWTGERGITGKFKFLTCSIVSDDIPQKIPLISVPISMGHYKHQVIGYCLSLVKPLIGTITLILFDRGFYDNNLMYDLGETGYPYLIFVPKKKDKKEILLPMKDGERQAVIHDFSVRRDGIKHEAQNLLLFLKQFYDPDSEKQYDWVFATNVDEERLGKIVPVYKKRWRIETGFRVQDEALIKCKSKKMPVRYFLFLFEQMLQAQWMCFYKEDASFKKWIIRMREVCSDLVSHPKKRYGNA